jgi:hypothetical protein
MTFRLRKRMAMFSKRPSPKVFDGTVEPVAKVGSEN